MTCVACAATLAHVSRTCVSGSTTSMAPPRRPRTVTAARSGCDTCARTGSLLRRALSKAGGGHIPAWSSELRDLGAGSLVRRHIIPVRLAVRRNSTPGEQAGECGQISMKLSDQASEDSNMWAVALSFA